MKNSLEVQGTFRATFLRLEEREYRCLSSQCNEIREDVFQEVQFFHDQVYYDNELFHRRYRIHNH